MQFPFSSRVEDKSSCSQLARECSFIDAFDGPADFGVIAGP